MSNLFSISNALNALDISPVITSDPKVILQSDGAILPGVGSYPEAVISLHDLDLFETIKNCEEGDDIYSLINGPICHNGFKRLN